MPFQTQLRIASRNNLVLLGTFITLLQAVAFTSADREALKKLWERLKWQLRIFSRGNELFEGALKRVDNKRTWVDSVLENFIPVSPIKRTREPSRNMHMSFVPPEGMSNFPEFSTQSMEDLLNTEGFVGQNAQADQGFHEGLFGFEDFSAWDGLI